MTYEKIVKGTKPRRKKSAKLDKSRAVRRTGKKICQLFKKGDIERALNLNQSEKLIAGWTL